MSAGRMRKARPYSVVPQFAPLDQIVDSVGDDVHARCWERCRAQAVGVAVAGRH